MENDKPSLPESDPASPVPSSVTGATDESDLDLSHVPAEHRDAVRRLYRQVETAVDTIERLRSENERLRERVEELEARPQVSEGETFFTVDDDPDALKGRISEFIDAIDTYLDSVPEESTTPVDEEDA